MPTVHVTAKRDFLDTLSAARPLAAVAELIWNGFDAESELVHVSLDFNKLEGLEAIRVRDAGTGIPHDRVDELFGSLGESWKKTKARVRGRALHGKSGKGRFKAFALGDSVQWVTTCRSGGRICTYKIQGHTGSLDDFHVSEPVDTGSAATGTEVIVSQLRREFTSLTDVTATQELARVFAAYLRQYPGLTLIYDGETVNPDSVTKDVQHYELGQLDAGEVRTPVRVSVVEWTFPSERALHLCDASGVALHDVPVGPQVRAPGFNFSAYVQTDHFRELDKLGLLALTDLHPEVGAILKAAKSKVKEHFRRKLAQDQSKIVDRWKAEHIYPYEDTGALTSVEEAERQVFDILAVNVQSYLPAFEDSDTRTKTFTFRLLAQAIRDNPNSVQTVIGEVLGLKKEAQDELADLLRKTPLASIISSARTVANRLDFLAGLENLLFDRDNKAKLLERDQLHKILENEAWLFSEEFTLAGSEQRLETVLAQHLGCLGTRGEVEPVVLSDGKQGRIDLMFHKSVQPRPGEYDYLIVELKRPSRKIDDEVITQIKKYARAVASDERFHGIRARWTFVAVSNELDPYARGEASQRDRPKGMISDDSEHNITVWVREWADVINDARVRLRFVNQQLAYEADTDSARAYLTRTHSKYIPDAPTSDATG